jgi:hypothetical protein
LGGFDRRAMPVEAGKAIAIMPTAQPMTPLGRFCADYLATANDVALWGKYFLIAALATAAALAAAEAWRRFKAPPASSQGGAAKALAPGVPIKELAEALGELAKALATAPVWLALMAVGLATFWVAGNALPAKCEDPAAYARPPIPAPSPSPTAGATSTPSPGGGG